MKKNLFTFLLIVVLLCACSPATAAPTRTEIRVQFSAAAQPWLKKASDCAGNIIFNIEQRSARTQDFSEVDLAIRIGQNELDPAWKPYQVGTEEVLVIANKQNPLQDLDREQVKALFSGQVRSWKDLGGSDLPVTVWVYTEGEDLQQIFDDEVMGAAPLTSLARLAASPDSMNKSVAEDPGAVGISTASLAGSDVKSIFTVGAVPVLALTTREPKDAAAQLISCLQK